MIPTQNLTEKYSSFYSFFHFQSYLFWLEVTSFWHRSYLFLIQGGWQPWDLMSDSNILSLLAWLAFLCVFFNWPPFHTLLFECKYWSSFRLFWLEFRIKIFCSLPWSELHSMKKSRSYILKSLFMFVFIISDWRRRDIGSQKCSDSQQQLFPWHVFWQLSREIFSWNWYSRRHCGFRNSNSPCWLHVLWESHG